jgi:hypothetical protein
LAGFKLTRTPDKRKQRGSIARLWNVTAPVYLTGSTDQNAVEEKDSVTPSLVKPMMILIAGPYRSGTNDDPALILRNVQEMEAYALPIFRGGHIPILGEWLALPLTELAGSRKVGDEHFNEIFHPIAVRLLGKCDAVLRVGGPSAGADEMVRVGRSLGLEIYSNLSEIPAA